VKGLERLVQSTMSHAAVKNYAAAVTNLWVQQCAKGMNNSGHPRDTEVNHLLALVKQVSDARTRLSFEDRGRR
jgi:hypothetical protein